VYGVASGRGPFVTMAPSPAENLLQLQLFLIALAVPMLFLAAEVRQHARAAAAWRRSKEQYRSVVEDQTELICRFQSDGTYTFVNGAYCRCFQQSPEQLLGRSFWQFLPPEGHAEARAFLESITPEQPVATREHPVLSPDGEIRWQHWTDRGFFDAQGRIVEYQAVGRDITEHKRAEEQRRQLEAQVHAEAARRQSEERFRILADSAPVLIWTSGLRNEAQYFNKTWLDFTGRTLEQELDLGWVESIHPDDRQRCIESSDAAFAVHEPVSMQFRLRRHDGEYRWVFDNGIPRFGPDGAFAGYIGTCVDITEHQRAEEALQEAARRKDEFLALLGHELRNPLAPISMAIELMRSSAPGTDSVAWAREVIARQLAQLTRVVDDLLDISRITRGKIRLQMSPIVLDDVIRQAVETSRPLIAQREHELAVDVPHHPLRVRGDAVRLTQVVSNLLNNAAKYTDVGGRIGLALKQDGAQAVIKVTDNGIGIPAHMLERVFDLFTQADSGSRAQGGLGIGLTLVRRLVEMHAGTIEAHSPGPGRGSEFVVRLPVGLDVPVGAELDESPDGRPAGLAGGSAPEHKRILVVDDNVDAAESLSRMLRLLEHEVRVAHDGIEALAAAEHMQPDVVLLDIGLPRMDGLEVARRLREWAFGTRPLLVATTGFDQAEDRRRIAEAGFDHHLIKPLDPGVLRSLVESGKPR
jgi:PAS domain S-box-containing protein